MKEKTVITNKQRITKYSDDKLQKHANREQRTKASKIRQILHNWALKN